jgi:uncharacterized phage protein (TIGR01671 family)
MREMKFRGLRTDGKGWVYGDLVHDYWIQDKKFYKTAIRYLINGVYSFPIEVIPESVGQFTGLPDKNGVEIYEGDIVKLDQSYIKPITVYWNNEITGFYPLISQIYWQVIGNIHQNKELI